MTGARCEPPPELRGKDGDHWVQFRDETPQIARWQRERSLETTARRRPDLLAAARAQGRLTAEDERFLAGLSL